MIIRSVGSVAAISRWCEPKTLGCWNSKEYIRLFKVLYPDYDGHDDTIEMTGGMEPCEDDDDDGDIWVTVSSQVLDMVVEPRVECSKQSFRVDHRGRAEPVFGSCAFCGCDRRERRREKKRKEKKVRLSDSLVSYTGSSRQVNGRRD